MSRTWYWPGLAVALLLSGCGGAAFEAKSAAPGQAPSPPPPDSVSGSPGLTQSALTVSPGAVDAERVGSTLDAAAVRDVAIEAEPNTALDATGTAGVPRGAELLPERPASPKAPPPVAPSTGDDPTAAADASETAPEPPAQTVTVAQAQPIQAMMDIEAHLSVEVKDVGAAVRDVRALVRAAGGQILEERVEDAKREAPSATFTLRVPSTGAFDFLNRLEATGLLRSRQITSRDVGKEYFDATLRLRSLEQILHRYQALLAKATTVEDTLKIEEHIARVSAQIEQIKGELRWLSDRVARATVHVEIFAKGGWVEPVVTPEAKLYPGIRAVGSWDWRGADGSEQAMGAGVSLRFARHFSIDFDGLQNTESRRGDLEMALLTLGGEFYSDFLGAGQRRWLNPYLGFRGGYGRIESNHQILVGGTLGLELFKGDILIWDLEARALSAFADDLGAHVLVLPAMGVNVAF